MTFHGITPYLTLPLNLRKEDFKKIIYKTMTRLDVNPSLQMEEQICGKEALPRSRAGDSPGIIDCPN